MSPTFYTFTHIWIMTSSESAACVSFDCKRSQGREGPETSPQQIKIEGGIK